MHEGHDAGLKPELTMIRHRPSVQPETDSPALAASIRANLPRISYTRITELLAQVIRGMSFPRPQHMGRDFQRGLRTGLAILPAAALALCMFGVPARAQSNGYAPPPPGPYDGPRSITPPQGGGPYNSPGYGDPYAPPPSPPPPGPGAAGPYGGPPPPGAYSSSEIIDAGHYFFGSVSEGLAKVVEHGVSRYGDPTGYILGEDAGGALVAGLRYGEGTLYMKGYPPAKVYWQGPSFGYDFGADGAKVMTLVYNLPNPSQIYERFGGIDGSAYIVGGVGITFLKRDDITLAPIRAGVGLRLGANLGYLKYTPSPTWNPF